MRKFCCFLAISGLIAGLSPNADAAEVTRVATAFEDDNKFDLHFGVAYDFNFKRAAILREWNPGDADVNETRLVKDLVYKQQRHVVTPSVEIGLWHDLAVYVTLPIVVHDTRGYEFDQRADDCVFGDQAQFPDVNCVNKANSTTIRDGIIPFNGFDATDSSNPFGQFAGADTHLIFKGPVRRGLDQLHVGLKYGILNQEKLSHMPNWVLALEGRFAVGRAMTFTRDIQTKEPEGNTRVGRKIHELGVWTALSRRYRYLDPFVTTYWRYGLRATGSKFEDYSKYGAQDMVNPQSHTGITFGTEVVPWERKARRQKVALMFKGSAELHYGGRGYSEIWELLADSPALAGNFDPTATPSCDVAGAIQDSIDAPGNPAYAADNNCEIFTGVTDLQDFATFGFDFGLNFHLGPYARLSLGTELQSDTRHFLTFADRGDTGDNDLVDPGTTEVNPVRRDVVDDVGRRYVIDDVLSVAAYLRFLLTF